MDIPEEDIAWLKSVGSDARGFQITVINQLEVSLVLVLSALQYGDWAKLPPATVAPANCVRFGSVANSWMAGTEGELTYATNASDAGLKVFWSNPYSFWNSANVRVESTKNLDCKLRYDVLTHPNGYLLHCQVEVKRKALVESKNAAADGFKTPQKQPGSASRGTQSETEAGEDEGLGLVDSVKKNYERIINAFVRPPRHVYEVEALGAPAFMIGDVRCSRDDFQLKNKWGLTLQCSCECKRKRQKETFSSFFSGFFQGRPRPCVVYCHANSGSRVHAKQTMEALLPYGVSVVCFDFSGSGLSDGEHVTLGLREHQDIACVIRYVRSQANRCGRIALWGRSMGAVATLLYARSDPSLAAIVCDSAFSDLPLLCEQMVAQQQSATDSPVMARRAASLPSFIVRGALYVIANSIEQRCDLDIYQIRPIEDVPFMRVPVLFLHGNRDTMVNSWHTEQMHSNYGGSDKMLLFVDQGHNATRPQQTVDQIVKFLCFRLTGSSAHQLHQLLQEAKNTEATPSSSSSSAAAVPKKDDDEVKTEPSPVASASASSNVAETEEVTSRAKARLSFGEKEAEENAAAKSITPGADEKLSH